METFFRLPSAGEAPPTVAALGVFDGVHLGHQRVIQRVVEWAREKHTQSAIITFERHPRAILERQTPLFITSLKHKLLLLERLGVERCLVLDFDRDMSQMSARDFAEQAFDGAVGVVMGYDQRFGRGREGDAALLRTLGAERGFEVALVEPVTRQGKPISSTALRQAISAGRLDYAAEMLGRRPSVMGTVVVGEGRGKNLGFPTANLDLQGEAHPPQGVYRTQTVAVGKQWDSVTNIGRRPTFTPKERDHTGSVVVETHLLHFKGDLLGEDVEVIFLEKVRNEVRCRSEEQLMKLIAADVEYARSRAAQ